METPYGSQAIAFGTQAEEDHDFTDYELLKQALMNEKASPEILQFENNLIERIYHWLEHQESLIQETESSSDMELLRAIFSVETTRVKYMLRSYLRTRLLKIERFAMYCMDKPEMRARLSPQEDAYAEKYVTLVGHHLADNVTKKLPDAFASVTRQASAHPANDMISAPDLGRHVFARVLRDLGNVAVYEDGGTAELAKDDLYILRYNMLRPLLEQRAVQLC